MQQLIYIIALCCMAAGCKTPDEVRKEVVDDAFQRGVVEGKGSYDQVKEEGYKQGQIDALTGHIKFRLTEGQDRQLTWQPATFPTSRPISTIRSRTANEMPYLAPMNDGHGGYIYVPMQELNDAIEK